MEAEMNRKTTSTEEEEEREKLDVLPVS